MYWKDEGYLLSKNNFDENSIIIETFTLNHGKYSGVVYGGSSRKQKKKYQIGNKILLNWKSKSENRIGYFNTELINAISPQFFEDKRKTACILSSSTILKILLPEGQINKKIYISFEKMLHKLKENDWIKSYILWELFLIKELGFEINFLDQNNKVNSTTKSIKINTYELKIPSMFFVNDHDTLTNIMILEALKFNKILLVENFISPNKLRFPISRNLLEKYYK